MTLWPQPFSLRHYFLASLFAARSPLTAASTMPSSSEVGTTSKRLPWSGLNGVFLEVMPDIPGKAGVEVAGGGGAELFTEHGDERAGAAVSRLQSRGGHFFTGGQKLQGTQETELLAPASEGHLRFRQKEPLNGAFAGATIPAQGFQRPRIGGICRQAGHDSQRT